MVACAGGSVVGGVAAGSLLILPYLGDGAAPILQVLVDPRKKLHRVEPTEEGAVLAALAADEEEGNLGHTKKVGFLVHQLGHLVEGLRRLVDGAA